MMAFSYGGELQFIADFVQLEDFKYEISQAQLRALWTAFCLHWSLEPDTFKYDEELLGIWEVVRNNPSNPWLDDIGEGILGYELFDSFMGERLA